MFNDVQHTLKQEGAYCYRRSGSPESGWMVLDYVDVVMHIFSGEMRTYYAIEELLEGAPRLA
jgi:ribosome-associated protein